MSEIILILVVALVFLGPRKLPELASGLGKMIREVRKATADIKSEIELDETIRKPLEELREATMLPPEELKRRDLERKLREQYEREERERQEQAAKEAEQGAPAPTPDVPPADGTVPSSPAYASSDGDRTIAMDSPPIMPPAPAHAPSAADTIYGQAPAPVVPAAPASASPSAPAPTPAPPPPLSLPKPAGVVPRSTMVGMGS